jgi:Ras homolog enriched in brain
MGIHGYIFVYSIASKNSFDMIQIVYDKIVDFSGMTDIPCIIVGTKCDLSSGYVPFGPSLSNSSRPPRRKVDRLAGENLARANNGAFEEASAKDGMNVCTYPLGHTTNCL